ncbi:MAG: LpxI family protein [Octadecabacter sp.]
MSIALIAGTGDLPPILVSSLVAQNKAPIICEMRGFQSTIEGDFERVRFRFETLGTFLKTLRSMGVKEVCMAGAMQRPKVEPRLIDTATIPLVPRLMKAMSKGDDGTLREIVALFEEKGFSVVGAHQIEPNLLPHNGVLTKVAPPDLTEGLAAAGAALTQMGRADLGQAMLVRAGKVIAREGARGTAALLENTYLPSTDPTITKAQKHKDIFIFGAVIGLFASMFAAAMALGGQPTIPKLEKRISVAGAFLFKAPKPDQMLLVDMPTIGPETAKQAAGAGLAGIVIKEAGVIVLDLPQVISILDAQGMYLLVTP